jgi:hypothetical protein
VTKDREKKNVSPIYNFYKRLTKACDTYDSIMEWYDLVDQLVELANKYPDVLPWRNISPSIDEARNLVDQSRSGIENACMALRKDLKGLLEEYLGGKLEEFFPEGAKPITLGRTAIAAIGGGGAATILLVAVLAFTITDTCPPQCPPLPPPPPPQPQFDFALNLPQQNFSVLAGDTVSVPLSVATTSGNPEQVTISCSTKIFTGSCQPVSLLPSPAADSTINISVSQQMPAGTYTVSIDAQGGGVSKASDVNLIVSEAPHLQLKISDMSPENNAEVNSLPITLSVLISVNPPVKGAKVDFFLDGDFFHSTASDSEGIASVDVNELSPGSHTWYAKAAKHGFKSKEVSKHVFHYVRTDQTIPDVRINTPTNGSTVVNMPVNIRGNAFDDSGVSKVEVKIDDMPYQKAAGTTKWKYVQELTNGPHTITAKAIDNYGNENTSSITIMVDVSLPVDITPPPIPQLLSPNGILDGNKPVFDWTDISDPSGVTYDLTVTKDGKLAIDAKNLPTSTFNPGIGYADGTYTWYVTVKDGAGNVSTTHTMIYTIVTIPIDTDPPSPPNLLTPSGTIKGNMPVFDWTDVSDQSGIVYDLTVTKDGKLMIDAKNLPTSTFNPGISYVDGTYIWYVTVKDGAGNTSTTSTMTYTIDTAPTIS